MHWYKSYYTKWHKTIQLSLCKQGPVVPCNHTFKGLRSDKEELILIPAFCLSYQKISLFYERLCQIWVEILWFSFKMIWTVLLTVSAPLPIPSSVITV